VTAGDEWLRERNAQYDQAAKKVLSQRKMLAWILSRVVTEFAGVPVRDIADKYIVGEPEVGTTPVNRDKTNAPRKAQQEHDRTDAPRDVRQDRNEDGTTTEGTIYFDIRFHAKAPRTGGLITLIINVEAQKSKPSGYDILKRAVFYASRLISAQKETEFQGSDYNGIRKVYTIWLCMRAPEREGSSITSYTLHEKKLFGHHTEPQEHYDLINITLLYLGNRRTGDKLIELLRLVFRSKAGVAIKKERLAKQYELNLTDDMAEEMNTMCNLSEGFYEDGIQQGIKRGIKQGVRQGVKQGIEQGVKQGEEQTRRSMVLSMLREKVSLDIIAKVSGWTVESVRQFAERNKVQLA